MTGFTFDHTPTQDEFDRFAAISGDANPIHIDPDFSARTRFGRTVSHGMLLYSIFWGALRRRYPKMRTARQSLKFSNPAFAGETLRYEARAEEQAEGALLIDWIARRIADGAAVCEGQTLLTGPTT